MGKVKALLPLPLGAAGESCSALEGLTRLFRHLGIEHISVVTGWHAAHIEPAAQALGLAVARNPRPEDGMFSSVCVGLSALAGGDPALAEMPVLVQPVDVPLVRPMTIQALLEAHAADPENVLVPTFAGQEGHPPLLPARHLAHVLRHAHTGGENGLRGALEGLPVRHIPVADGLMLPDMDRPEDYESMRLLASRRETLRPDEALELLRLHEVPEKGLRHGRAVGTVAAALAKALLQARRTKKLGLAGNAATAPDLAPGFDLGLDSGLAPGFAPVPDPDLALAGGLTHDICKGEKRHEAAAGRLFRHLHLPVMAHLVEDHRDLTLPDDQPITERELVFLADKYCYGSSFVPVRQRFEQKFDTFGAEAAQAIKGRMERALAMEARLAHELDCRTGGQSVQGQDRDYAQGEAPQPQQSPQPTHTSRPMQSPHASYPEDIARAALTALAMQLGQAQGDSTTLAPMPR